MRKASRLLTIILIAVLLLSVFAGCDLVTKNTAKYRAQTVFNIGNETVTVGKLLDSFNSNYNQYYMYIAYYGWTLEDLLQLTINSLVQQNIQVHDYVSNPAHQVVSPTFKDRYHNAEYLTAAQLEYCIKYVQFLSYSAFDKNVEERLSKKYDIGEAKTEDTSRDFTEYDDLKGYDSYAEYLFNQNFVSEEADEYFSKYYAEMTFDEINIDGYVFASEVAAKAKLDELNDRLEKDEDDESAEVVAISFDDYKEAQQKTLKQYGETVKNNYGIELKDFFVNQVNDMVAGCIRSMWSYETYKDLENDADLQAKLAENFATLKASQEAQFNITKGFDKFITSLSSTSAIYNVPENLQQKYVFVKNILIPFSSVQTNILNGLANRLGSTEREQYINKRNEFAAGVEAEYFYSEKYDEAIESKYFGDLAKTEDDENEYEKIADIFKLDDNNQLVINPDGLFGEFFKADGSVAAMEGKTTDETIVELMKRFNTDTAQHTAAYDYVVYVGEDWEDYNHNWVKEFYTATQGVEKGHYALAISDYGVHIIYVVGYVEDRIFEFKFEDRLNTATQSYTQFKSYFETQLSLLSEKAYEEVQKKVVDSGLISAEKVFKRFLKDNGFTFDFDEYVESLKDAD